MFTPLGGIQDELILHAHRRYIAVSPRSIKHAKWSTSCSTPYGLRYIRGYNFTVSTYSLRGNVTKTFALCGDCFNMKLWNVFKNTFRPILLLQKKKNILQFNYVHHTNQKRRDAFEDMSYWGIFFLLYYPTDEFAYLYGLITRQWQLIVTHMIHDLFKNNRLMIQFKWQKIK